MYPYYDATKVRVGLSIWHLDSATPTLVWGTGYQTAANSDGLRDAILLGRNQTAQKCPHVIVGAVEYKHQLDFLSILFQEPEITLHFYATATPLFVDQINIRQADHSIVSLSECAINLM